MGTAFRRVGEQSYFEKNSEPNGRVSGSIMRGPILFLLLIFLPACAHSPPVTDLDQLRQGCISSGGVFHVTYGDYPTGWIADTAQCWHGATIADVERIQSLDD